MINERLLHTAAEAASTREGLILQLDANDVDSYDGDGDVWYDISEHDITAPLSSDGYLELHLNASDTTSYDPATDTTTWTDISGNGNDATLTSLTNTDHDIDNGGFFTFDGSSDLADVGNISAFNTTNSFTLEFWENRDDTAENNLASKGSYPSDAGWFFSHNPTYGYYFYDYGTGSYIRAGSAYSANQWRHVVLTWNAATKTPSLFVDGESVTGTVNIGAGAGTNNTVTMQIGNGANRAGVQQAFDGKIGVVRGYSKILSASEIGQNYRHGRDYIYTNIVNTGLNLHLDPSSYSGSGTTWTADTGNDATVVSSRYDQELGDSFDISTDGESTIEIASGHPLNGTDFTLEFWYKWQSAPIAANRFIYEAGTGWSFFYFGGNGWRIANADCSTGYFSNNVGVTVGKWHHFIITQNSSQNKVYIDGELLKTTSVTSGTRSLGAFDFGSTDITADKPKCDIGQIRIYSSVLTADEVMQNYLFTNKSYPNGINFTGNNMSSADWNSSGYFDFNGTDESFQTSGTPSALINATDFTVSAWVRMHTAGTIDYIASQTTADGGTQNWLLRFHSDNTIRFYVYGTDEYLSTSSTYSANVWYHITGLVESDGTVRIYVNGVLEASSGSGKSADTTSYNTFIGSLGGSSSGRFDGDIGAVKYYKKALTSSEILADYNANKSTYGL